METTNDLLAAVERGDEVAVAHALQGGVSLADIDAALLRASNQGRVDLAKLVLTGDTETGGMRLIDTALIRASGHGDVDVVKMLLALGADVHCVSGCGATALLATEYGYTKNCQARLGDTDVVLHEQDGVSPSTDKHLEVLRDLLAAGANVNYVDTISFVPTCALSIAAASGHVASVRVMLDAGASVAPEGTRAMYTPLMVAAACSQANVVELLLAAGADVNDTGWQNTTALLEAAKKGCVRVIELLLDAGADVHRTNRQGDTALTIACRFRRDAVAEKLRGWTGVPANE